MSPSCRWKEVFRYKCWKQERRLMFNNSFFTGISCPSSKRRHGIKKLSFEKWFGCGRGGLAPPPPSPGDTSPKRYKYSVCRPMLNEI